MVDGAFIVNISYQSSILATSINISINTITTTYELSFSDISANLITSTALNEEMIAGAGLDVLTKEPMSTENPLVAIKDSRKLLITPHMAWASTEARNRCVQEAYKNVEAFLNGQERNVIV